MLETKENNSFRRLIWPVGALGMVLLIGVGVFASNGWFPRTDSLSGTKFGWFGKELSEPPTGAPAAASASGVAKSAGGQNAGGWNPLAAPPPPSPTPQLSKEYIYAGSRLLAVEDASWLQP